MIQSAAGFAIQGWSRVFIRGAAVRAILATLAFLAIQAEAQAQTMWNVVPNGDVSKSAIVNLYAAGNNRVFRYGVPDMHSPAKRGDLMFQGVNSDGQYVGKVFVPSERCSSLSYVASGTVGEDQRTITLYGKAPEVDQQCRVVSYRDEVLFFNFIDLNANTPMAHEDESNGANAVAAPPGATLVCLVPEFTEEHKLMKLVDGNPATTDWVAQSVNYLRDKYCVVVAAAPEATNHTWFGDGCGQDEGYYQGELVYWGECHE